MNKNFLNVQASQDLTRSPTARSADYSRNSFQAQSTNPVKLVNQLKQKAHKSFMQVINRQMEALHQQQIEMMMKQHEQQQQKFRSKQQLLTKRIKGLQNQLKNFTRNIIQDSNVPFTIQNIQDVQFKDQSNYLDDSSIYNLKQMLNNKQCGDKLRNIQNEVKKQMKNLSQGSSDSKNIIDKLFLVFNQINNENLAFKQLNEEVVKKNQKLESENKTLKIQNQSTQKEVKFLSDHIKRLHNDKALLDKKIIQLQRTKKFLQDNIKNGKKNNNLSSQISYNSSNLQNYYRSRKNSVITNSDSNSSKQIESSFKGNFSTKLARMSSQTGIVYQPSPNILASIKNFRKKQNYMRIDQV